MGIDFILGHVELDLTLGYAATIASWKYEPEALECLESCIWK